MADAPGPIDDPLASDSYNIQPPILDPPPPYPSRERRQRFRRHGSRTNGHNQFSSAESDSGVNGYGPLGVSADDEETASPTENTPFIHSPPGSRANTRRRARALSHTSTTSTASSFAQTICSLFIEYDDDDEHAPGRPTSQSQPIPHDPPITHSTEPTLRSPRDPSLAARVQRYFAPMTRRVYWLALFHLLVINFPYALAAWIYLFVFTVTGTTLLIILPLGAVLCFFNLLGARLFARGELALQTKFHRPLSLPVPSPLHPLFVQHREPTVAEIEAGTHPPGQIIPEKSFYKNTYVMFTDPMSYQSLFYFLVVKAGITLLLSIAVVVAAPVCLVLVLPAPMMLRAVRTLGIWQAEIAIEGLFVPVRLR